MPVYNNYECHTEMKEIDTAYVMPQMYIENTKVNIKSHGRLIKYIFHINIKHQI